MKLLTEAFLDKWEALATQRPKRWRTQAPPKWVIARSPDLQLQPTDKYTFQMYMRQTACTILPPIFFYIVLGWFLLFVGLWFCYRPILQNPKYHKMLIAFLSREGFYLTPWAVLLMLIFNYLFWLPRFYFWNRRAERLRREPPVPDTLPEAATVDISVWPPPPKRPAA